MSTDILFLFSYMRNSASGKPDWNAVCDECKIISAGAAAKRWSRLKPKLEADLASLGGVSAAVNPATPKGKGGKGAKGSAKKRKVSEDDEDDIPVKKEE